jgi:hypothetical protein
MGSDDYSNNSPPVCDQSHTLLSSTYSLLTQRQEASFHDFQTFDPYTQQQFPIAKPLTPQTPAQQLPKHAPQINNNPGLGGFEAGNFQDQERRESPSDDEEKTPAQTRRKAQNRAA